MKKIIQFIISIMVMAAFTQSVFASRLPMIANLPAGQQPEQRRGIIETHDAIESESLRISIGGDLNGFVEGKICDDCETIKVNITPATKAYKNGKEVSLLSAKNRLGRFATVIFEVKTKNVSAIRW